MAMQAPILEACRRGADHCAVAPAAPDGGATGQIVSPQMDWPMRGVGQGAGQDVRQDLELGPGCAPGASAGAMRTLRGGKVIGARSARSHALTAQRVA
jgi:hypothetical protein